MNILQTYSSRLDYDQVQEGELISSQRFSNIKIFLNCHNSQVFTKQMEGVVEGFVHLKLNKIRILGFSTGQSIWVRNDNLVPQICFHFVKPETSKIQQKQTRQM